MLGGGAEQQQGQPLPLGIGHHVIKALAKRLRALQIVMGLQQFVEPGKLGWFQQPHLNLVQERLLVGGRPARRLAQARELKKVCRRLSRKK